VQNDWRKAVDFVSELLSFAVCLIDFTAEGFEIFVSLLECAFRRYDGKAARLEEVTEISAFDLYDLSCFP